MQKQINHSVAAVCFTVGLLFLYSVIPGLNFRPVIRITAGCLFQAISMQLLYPDSTGPARHIAISDNGDIYVKMRHSDRGQETFMLRDVDGDGKADSSVHFGDYDNEGSLANCMRIHNGYLYFASELVVYQQLTRAKWFPKASWIPYSQKKIQRGSHWHITKPDGTMTGICSIPFGAPSNALPGFGKNTWRNTRLCRNGPLP